MFCWSSRRVATTSSGESPAERWAADDLAPCIDITYPWGEAKETIRHGDTWTSGAFRIRVFAGFSRLSSASLIILDPAHRIAIFGGTSALDALGHEAIEEWLQAAREKCVRDELQSDGYLRTAAQGLSRGAFWNTIWEPARNRPLPVFSRRWCVNFGGWVDAPADNFAQAASTMLFSQQLACLNVEEMLTEANSEGMVPNIGAANGTSIDRSEPRTVRTRR